MINISAPEGAQSFEPATHLPHVATYKRPKSIAIFLSTSLIKHGVSILTYTLYVETRPVQLLWPGEKFPGYNSFRSKERECGWFDTLSLKFV